MFAVKLLKASLALPPQAQIQQQCGPHGVKLPQVDYHLRKPQLSALREEIPPEDAAGADGSLDVRCFEKPLVYKRMRFQHGGNHDRHCLLIRQVTRLGEDNDASWRPSDRKQIRLLRVVTLDDYKRAPLNDISLV
jgi:hypothetical protein